jgi:N-acetylglutamate synthase-like GNAT family acetyltransferase
VYQNQAGEQVVGVSQLARASADAVEAEVACVIRDGFQGLGLGTPMLSLLSSVARCLGIERAFGWVLTDNRHMFQLFRKSGLPLQIEHESGAMLVQVLLVEPQQKTEG